MSTASSPRRGHEHARRRVARLAAIAEARIDASRHSRFEIGVVEQDVRRLAAQFLVNALDGRRSELRDLDAGARGARERHHVDIGMTAQRRAHGRPIAIDQIEDTSGDASGIDDLGEQHGIERRHLAGLQHHRAARGDRRRDLADDLIDRPVPRRNQRDDTDGLMIDQRRALLALPFEGLARAQHFFQMPLAKTRLPRMRELSGRADLAHDRLGHLVITFEIHIENAPDQRNAFFRLRPGKRRKRALRRRHSAIDILRIAERHFGKRLFGAGIDDWQTRGAGRLDPIAVDIELQ